MKSNKLLLKLVSLMLLLAAIFTFVSIPTKNIEIKNLPIAIVNQDKGELGNKIAEKILGSSASNEMLDITKIENKDKLLEEMNNENYYGAIVIPEDFSANVASLRTADSKNIELDVIINQGKNAQVSSQVETLLTTMANNIGDNITNQMLIQLKSENISLSVDQVLKLKDILKVNTEIINPVGNLKIVTMPFFLIMWLTAMAAAIISYLQYKKEKFTTIKEELIYKTKNILYIILSSSVMALCLPYLLEWVLGYDINNYWTMVMYLALSSFTFIVLILGLLNVLGFVALPIVMFTVFFGIASIQVVPEMLADWYNKYFLSWYPIRYFLDGIRNILFFNSNNLNEMIQNLSIFTTLGLISIFVRYKKINS